MLDKSCEVNCVRWPKAFEEIDIDGGHGMRLPNPLLEVPCCGQLITDCAKPSEHAKPTGDRP